MRPIPAKLRARLAADPFMARCVYGCADRPEWEHAFIYAGRQINEWWAIVPVCWFHHRGPGLDKSFNQFVALCRASSAELAKYPRFDWASLRRFLFAKFSDGPKC